MNRTLSKLLVLSAIPLFFFLTASSALSQQQKVVTASQVNGTWNAKTGTFKIWALGNQRLKVEFDGIYRYSTPDGPMANSGIGSGIATIEGDTAVFKPDGAEDECKITMKFVRGKMIVGQEGICGFGFNVTAEGTYRKTSARKPKFEENRSKQHRVEMTRPGGREPRALIFLGVWLQNFQ